MRTSGDSAFWSEINRLTSTCMHIALPYTEMVKSRVGNSLSHLKIAHIKEQLGVICSCCSFKKATVSLFTKEWPWANCSCCSLQKSNRERNTLDFFKKSNLSDSPKFLSKKRVIRSQKNYFLNVFDSFSPSLLSLSHSFLKSDGRDSL